MTDKTITAFNVRTYALIIEKGKILLSNELINGKEIIKFPGGGVEFGEGIVDALKREAKEEMNSRLENIKHFYTTDFFQKSQFKNTDQLISIYYKADFFSSKEFTPKEKKPLKDTPVFFWMSLNKLKTELFHFPIDKHVCKLIHEI
jgi:ADP-ribose pyrophosphatase YjhB (NUDIX family)